MAHPRCFLDEPEPLSALFSHGFHPGVLTVLLLPLVERLPGRLLERGRVPGGERLHHRRDGTRMVLLDVLQEPGRRLVSLLDLARVCLVLDERITSVIR